MGWTDWISREPRILGYAALGMVILGSSLGNVFFKMGAHAGLADAPFFGLLRWQTIIGVGCFGLGAVAYAWALKQFDLHVAQIVVSLQFVSVIALSFFFFGEQISTNQWIGIALIALGLFVCSR